MAWAVLPFPCNYYGLGPESKGPAEIGSDLGALAGRARQECSPRYPINESLVLTQIPGSWAAC